jgi:hypothetical protein
MTEDTDDIEAPAEKTFVRSVRLTPSAWAEVQRRAERAGMLVNSYVVWAISRAPERADIRDEAAPLALSDGAGGKVDVASAADVRAAAAAVVIDDDGDALLAMAAREADGVVTTPDVSLPDDVAWFPHCGHPDIPANHTKRGAGRRPGCKACRNATTRESRKRVKERGNAKVVGKDRGVAGDR